MIQSNLTVEFSTHPHQLKSLTGIRGLAAISVLLFHIGQGLPHWSILPFLYSYSFVKNGFRGVDLFFALSGFIMMHVHAQDFTCLQRAAILRFALQRIVRIYPAAFVALLLILIATLAFPSYVSWFRSWASLIPLKSYTWPAFVQTATLSSRWLMPDLEGVMHF
jgi:peptidoglycan/LPS O-acetylase OafA/YrhL